MGDTLLFFRPLLENFVHVHGGLLQHLVADVGVDVGGGLVVGVADDLHAQRKEEGRGCCEGRRREGCCH